MSGGFESVQIECPKYGDKKIVIDGKELDISKIRAITVKVDCNGIFIDCDVISPILPYK